MDRALASDWRIPGSIPVKGMYLVTSPSLVWGPGPGATNWCVIFSVFPYLFHSLKKKNAFWSTGMHIGGGNHIITTYNNLNLLFTLAQLITHRVIFCFCMYSHSSHAPLIQVMTSGVTHCLFNKSNSIVFQGTSLSLFYLSCLKYKIFKILHNTVLLKINFYPKSQPSLCKTLVTFFLLCNWYKILLSST